MFSVPSNHVSSPLLQPVWHSFFHAQRHSDKNKTQDTWGQVDIAGSPDSDVREPQKVTTRAQEPQDLGTRLRIQQRTENKSAGAPGAKQSPTRPRLQSGRSAWQMPFKRVIKDGFMWSVCSKAVNYLGQVTVIGLHRAYLGCSVLQHWIDQRPPTFLDPRTGLMSDSIFGDWTLKQTK